MGDENIGKRERLLISVDHFEPHPRGQAECRYDGYKHDDERDAAHGNFLNVFITEGVDTDRR